MHRHITAAALAATTLLALTACSSSSSDPKPTATPSVDMSSIDAGVGIPPKPVGAARDAYLAAIKAVDPQLVADPDKAISNGRNQCSTLNDGGANPNHAAAVRFDTTDTEGALLNAALRTTLCPKS